MNFRLGNKTTCSIDKEMDVSEFTIGPFESKLKIAPPFDLDFFKHIYKNFRTKKLINISNLI